MNNKRIEKIKGDANPNQYAAEIKFALRVPLNNVIGFTEMLCEQAETDGLNSIAQDLDKIETSAKQLLEKLNALIDVSHLNSDTVEISAIPDADKRMIEDAVMSADLMDGQSDQDQINGKILLVDDSAVNRDLFTKQIRHFGHDVTTAEDGYAALKLIRENSFDLILLDLLMPRMNGYQVLDKLKSNAETSSIPVIIISALDNLDNVVQCIQLGAEDFIPKPFNTVMLKTRISHILEKKQLWDEREKHLETIRSEQEKANDLLLNILPASIAERLKDGANSCAERFDTATILFADINGFTTLSEKVSAYSLIDFLNEIFSEFDDISAKNGIEKIKTIGDCYMAACGVPKVNPDHAELICRTAVEMMNRIPTLTEKLNMDIGITIGINSGPVVAGVIGKNKFSYDLWGDTVNIASRLEAFGKRNGINVSESTFKQVKDLFKFNRPFEIDVKGKGLLKNYLLHV